MVWNHCLYAPEDIGMMFILFIHFFLVTFAENHVCWGMHCWKFYLSEWHALQGNLKNIKHVWYGQERLKSWMWYSEFHIDYRFNSPKHELGPVPMFVTNAEGTTVCPLCSWAESQFSLCCQTGSNGKSVYICSKCGAETLPYGRSLSDSLSFRAFMVSYLFVQRSNRCSCMKNEIRARERRQNPVYVLTSVHMVNRCMEWVHLSDYWFLKVTQKYSLNDTDILKSAMCKIWSEF